MEQSCLGCHTNPPIRDAPFRLTTYEDVSSRSSLILTAISKQNGEDKIMPPSGRLPQATIDIVEEWISQGLLEN